MAIAVFTLILTRNLFSVIVLSGIYSFLMATILVALDAVDVAMTEASVGAGISTVLLLGALLVYGAFGLPTFGDPDAPIHQNVVPRYMQNETEVPNVVTAVLASFRGYDTLGETTVVFTAGAGLIALLRRRKTPKEASEAERKDQA